MNAIDAASIIESNFILSSPSTAGTEDNVSWGVRTNAGFHLWRNQINAGIDTGAKFCKTDGAPGITPKGCGGVSVFNALNMDIESNLIGGVRAPLSAAVYVKVAAAKSASLNINGNLLVAVGDDSGAAAGLAIAVSDVASAFSPIVVRNNILLGGKNTKAKRYGVFEVNDPTAKGQVTALTNNYFWDVDVAYATWNKTSNTDYADPNTVPLSSTKNNYLGDPQVRDDGHLKAGSPCIGQGLYDATEVKSTDIDGAPRDPLSMEIGADEVP